MAEVLGVAASVAGLITIADMVVGRGRAFIKDVKDAGETVEKLILEVTLLFGFLHSLRYVVDRLEAASNVDPKMQIHWIEPCYQTLLKIQGHLQKAMAGDSMTRTEKLKWPLRKSATSELLKEIERHKSNITMALSAKEMSALCEIRDGMQTLKTILQAEQTTRKKIVMDDKRHKMLQLLGTISARKWQDSNIRLRQPGTGIWFTEGKEFTEWLSHERSKLWINGIPGAGKTVLMSSTIQKIESELKLTEALAIFYCDYKDSSTHSASTILGSLARQLIMRHEDCFEDLTTFYEEHVSPDRSIRTPSPEELCELISKLSKHFDTAMIVVDGLDEITHGRADVSRFLASLTVTSPSIKALFSSRPEIDIGHVLSDYPTISIAAQSSDIRLYIASEIERRTADMRLEIIDPNLKEHIMATLADRCDGMFRWVACQMDYLCECSTDRDRREALTKLPPDLPSSYERILERVNRSSKANQSLVKGALHWISYANEDEPLTTNQLLQALAVREGDTAFDSSRMTTERRLLHWCSSLVRKNPTSGRLELAHFTVEEFLCAIDPLGKPYLAPYRLAGDHSILAKNCMRFLRCETFDEKSFPRRSAGADDEDDTIAPFLARHPFLSYAAISWSYHVRKSDPEEIDEAVLDFFTSQTGPMFQRMAAVWHYVSRERRKVEAAKAGISAEALGFQAETLNSTVTDNNMWPSPLHWAACFALDRVCTVLISNGADVHKQSILGTPIYCCMMPEDLFAEFFDFDFQAAGYLAWFDFYAAMYLDPDDDSSQRHSSFEALLQAGASTNVPASPDQVKFALDLAIQVELHDEGEISRRAYYVIQLLKSGARLSPDSLEIVTSRVLTEALHHDLVSVYAEYIWALIEAAVRAKWHPWSHQHLSELFEVISCPAWAPAGPQIERLGAALKETFQDAPISELNSILHNETERSSTRVLRTLLKTFELSCEASQAFGDAMESILPRILAYQRTELATLILLSFPAIDVDVQDETTGRSLLHLCLEDECIEEDDARSFVEVLLGRGASVIAVDRDGKSPLESAAMWWDLKMFKLLWESTSFRESRHTRYDLVNRILYDVISREDEELSGFLMKEMGISPQPDCAAFLEFALGQQDISAMCSILAEYAKIPWMWDIAMSSLHLAARTKVAFAVFESVLSTERIPHSQDAIGNTPFHHLVSMQDDVSVAKLKLLIGSGRSLEDLNKDGFTPLALAVRCKNFRATKMLLDAGANLHQTLTRGQTVMHLAACLGNINAVELLLQRSPYWVIEDDSGMTPEETALACGHDTIASIIRRAVNKENTIRPANRRHPELHDPHGKLPIRLVDHGSGYCATLDNGCDGPTDGSRRDSSSEDPRSSKMASPRTPFELSRLEATPDMCDSSSATSEYAGTHTFGSDAGFASKRRFQSLDSTVLEPAGKRSRQA
ncbi:hypothetical protein BKA61DRAFT_342569 [Leptodontidium sp. MPI-SDFR-AT-0119]|nr:hypothetical protein BKA61DRAFT_342569 [Leptodontidium sp. MPI-SDFR-AT-0119]